MSPYAWLFATFLVPGGLSLVTNRTGRQRAMQFYLWLAVPLLILFAGTRTDQVDADYGNLATWFSTLDAGPIHLLDIGRDPAFVIFGVMAHVLGLGYAYVAGIYAALCLAGQILFARAAVVARWFPLGLYLILSRFFILHEMTQTRAGVAIPLASLAIVLMERRKFLTAWCLFAAALTFHLSALAFLPVLIALAWGVEFRSRKWIYLLLPIAGACKILFASIFALLADLQRLKDYAEGGSYDTAPVTLFSFYFIIRVLLTVLLTTVYWPRLNRQQRVFTLCASLGVIVQWMLSAVDVFAIRGAELFGLFDVAAAMLLFHFLKPRSVLLYALLLLGMGGAFFHSGVGILREYHSYLLP